MVRVVCACVLDRFGAWSFNFACVLFVTYCVMFYALIMWVMCCVGVCVLFKCMCVFSS